MTPDKEQIYRLLMWDYDISPEEVDRLVRGETEHAGHYTRESLFKKSLESLPWFSVISIFGIQTILKYLNENLITTLRSNSLREKYRYIYARLQQAVSITG